MIKRGPYSSVNTTSFCIFQGFAGHFDVFLDGTGQCTNRRICDRFRYFDDGIKIARTGDREACFDDVHA